MATGKVLSAANGSFSLGGGFRSIFSCCFATPTASTTSRGKEGENWKNENSPDEGLDGEGREGADDKADTGAKDVREEGRLAVGEEGFIQTRRIRNPSEQDSTAYDEFRDSAIDSASLTSQFNLRGSVDGDTMKTGDNLEPGEEISHHENQNDDITEQYATQGKQESNDDDTDFHAAAPILMTSGGRTETGEGEGGEGVAEADIDAPAAETGVNHLDPETGKLEDAAVVNV